MDNEITTENKAQFELTADEKQRIEEQRKFLDIEPNTLSWKMALYVDPVKKGIRAHKLTIKKVLWNIENLLDKIKRYEEQIETGQVHEELKPGVLMNRSELILEINHARWIIEAEINGLVSEIAKIRVYVGIKDFAKVVIITLEEFEEYVKTIETKIKSLGYQLFE
jgi:hypothetical protein